MHVTPTSDQLNDEVVPQHTPVSSPESTGPSKFGKMLGTAINVAGQLASTVAGAQTMGLGPLAGNLASGLTGGGASALGGVGGTDEATSFESLLVQQEQIQRQSQVFTALTNISKAEHDTRMSAIRNFSAN